MPTKSAYWKTTSKQSKNNKKNKLAFLALGFLLLIIVFGQLIKFVNSLSVPLTSTLVGKTYLWDGSSNINLVIKGEEISVMSYNPDQKTVKIIKIPDNTYINVSSGFGSWPLRSVFDLGQVEKPPRGSQLLVQSVSIYFGIPMDGFLELKNKNEVDLVEFLQEPGFIFSANSKIRTDLTPLEIIRLTWGLRGVRFDKIKTYDLAELNLLKSLILSDGTTVLSADSNNIDTFAQNFIEDKISSERFTVAVLNATDSPGLAQKAARLITNMGGNVIQQTNFRTNTKASQIIVDLGDKEVLGSYTYRRLGNIFGLGCQKAPKCDKINSVETRARINIILGEDFYQRFQ